MSTIIAGRFEQQEQAAQVLHALINSGFSTDQVTTFYVNPPGQHAIHPVGGDEGASPGARDSGKGAAAGASIGGAAGLAAGIAAIPVVGPAGLVAAAGVGAYTGSLAGAMEQTDKQAVDEKRTDQGSAAQMLETTDRQAGVLVAVRADEPETQNNAINVLQTHGATDIEYAKGTLTEGQWSDFDPLATVTLARH